MPSGGTKSLVNSRNSPPLPVPKLLPCVPASPSSWNTTLFGAGAKALCTASLRLHSTCSAHFFRSSGMSPSSSSSPAPATSALPPSAPSGPSCAASGPGSAFTLSAHDLFPSFVSTPLLSPVPSLGPPCLSMSSNVLCRCPQPASGTCGVIGAVAVMCIRFDAAAAAGRPGLAHCLPDVLLSDSAHPPIHILPFCQIALIRLSLYPVIYK
ncbi:hypothetical protein DFH07DRAFT_960111 [Mycena maculata]|uniref:Uncharacterized protein n=1 Tax=Mycena maculata TaxID=230809 RepID=A0AAD7NBD6_9AGAR|nr:hypothetical protein DFH07DRAFT_960111 [Mycena maculata]